MSNITSQSLAEIKRKKKLYGLFWYQLTEPMPKSELHLYLKNFKRGTYKFRKNKYGLYSIWTKGQELFF